MIKFSNLLWLLQKYHKRLKELRWEKLRLLWLVLVMTSTSSKFYSLWPLHYRERCDTR